MVIVQPYQTINIIAAW